ncbi:hypothetical protein [Rahnella sp. BIGb0236]|uniref:hypothetical protein n=1 Tax=Rahnella sp. BIGb0236 TaxID=2485117 RepID=UPI00105C7FC6|nr:hypothetical protein [Rahnella sp. BIGb0236]
MKNDIYDNTRELARKLKSIDNAMLAIELINSIEYSNSSTETLIKIIYWLEKINVKYIDASTEDLLKITKEEIYEKLK